MSGFNFLDDENQQSAIGRDDPNERQVERQQQESADVDEMMSEAERRFEKAKYFKVLITHNIFGSDSSPMALEVFAEFQEFARNRMAACLGIGNNTKPALAKDETFTSEEVAILKQVVAKVVGKPQIIQPAIQTAEVPKQPQFVAAPSPVPQKPVQTQVKQTEKPQPKKPGPKPKGNATGETLDVPLADGTSIIYSKMVAPNGSEYWTNDTGNKFTLEVNESGKSFMRSIQRQSRPTGIQPAAPLNGQSMAIVASQQVQQLERSQDKMTMALATDALSR